VAKIDFRKIALVTERLVLKEISLEYNKQFLSMFSDLEVMRYTDKKLILNLSDADNYLKKSYLRSNKREHVFLGIFLKNHPELIGIIGIYHIDTKHQFASLGILIAKTQWRKGYMSEAMQCFLNFCFTELELNRIEAQTFVENIPAVRFFEKLNFKLEGRLRENFKIEGKFEDSYLFSILKKDYVLT
jgi:[ribosomal protein S5]-alanine N-acetyltransferase